MRAGKGVDLRKGGKRHIPNHHGVGDGAVCVLCNLILHHMQLQMRQLALNHLADLFPVFKGDFQLCRTVHVVADFVLVHDHLQDVGKEFQIHPNVLPNTQLV